MALTEKKRGFRFGRWLAVGSVLTAGSYLASFYSAIYTPVLADFAAKKLKGKNIDVTWKSMDGGLFWNQELKFEDLKIKVRDASGKESLKLSAGSFQVKTSALRMLTGSAPLTSLAASNAVIEVNGEDRQKKNRPSFKLDSIDLQNLDLVVNKAGNSYKVHVENFTCTEVRSGPYLFAYLLAGEGAGTINASTWFLRRRSTTDGAEVTRVFRQFPIPILQELGVPYVDVLKSGTLDLQSNRSTKDKETVAKYKLSVSNVSFLDNSVGNSQRIEQWFDKHKKMDLELQIKLREGQLSLAHEVNAKEQDEFAKAVLSVIGQKMGLDIGYDILHKAKEAADALKATTKSGPKI